MVTRRGAPRPRPLITSQIWSLTMKISIFFAAAVGVALSQSVLAGCSGSHLSAIPAAPSAAQEELPARSSPLQTRHFGGPLQVVRGHLNTEILRAPLVGNLSLQRKLHLAIGLPLRNPAEVRALLEAIARPSSSRQPRYLSPAEFQSRFSPSASDYQSVVDFAKAAGLTVSRTYEGRVVVDVEGSVAAIQRAFHLTLQTRRRPNGTLFYAPSN